MPPAVGFDVIGQAARCEPAGAAFSTGLFTQAALQTPHFSPLKDQMPLARSRIRHSSWSIGIDMVTAVHSANETVDFQS